MPKKYNLLKAVSAYTLSSVLVNGISFFVLPIFTRLLSTEEYGVFGLYSSYFSIFELLIAFGGFATVKMAKFDSTLDYEEYVSTILIVPLMVTLFIALIFNITLLFVKDFLSLNSILWNCLFVSAMFSAINNYICSKSVIDGDYRTKVVYGIIHTLVNIGLALLLCYIIVPTGKKYMSRVLGLLVSNLVSFLYLLLKFKIVRINFKYLKVFFKWATPLLFHTIGTILIIQSDRLILKHLKGFSVVGIYTIASTIVNIPMVVQSSIESSWAPWFLEGLQRKNYSDVYKVNNFYILFFSGIIASFMLVSPEIVHIFTSEQYWDSLKCLTPLAVTIFAEMLYCIPVNLEFYNKKSIFIFYGTLITFIINVILDFVLVHYFDYVGAAYATLISRLLLFLIHYSIAKKIDRNAIMNFYVSIFIFFILIVLNLLVQLFKNDYIVRYSILVLLFSLGLFYMKKNMEIISLVRGRNE